MIAMVLPLSSGSPHLWASRGEAAAPSGRGGEENREVAAGGTQRSMQQLLQPQMAGRSRTYYAVDGDAG